MSTPISHSEKLDYRIQYQIAKYTEEMIEHTQSCRPPAFLALGASQLTSPVLRVFSVGELTTRGLELICSSDRQLGKAMLKKASIKTLGIPWDVLNLIIGPFFMALDRNPKFHILYGVEYTKVDLEHAEQGTLDSEDHEYALQLAWGSGTTRTREWKKKDSAGPENVTSISHSERLDYHIQHQIFNYVNEITEQGQRLRHTSLARD